MKLTELFTGEKQIQTTEKSQADIVRNDVVNRQIRSMIPGQTLQGEVISRNGSEVQIRLAEDMVLQARLDRNMNLEIGRSMTFEVKNNGQTLTLSPLFTNMATDANVLKALDMASLPINGTTVSMTKQLMETGLSIDRNSLQQVYREVNLFPQAETGDIVNLHKLQMPVNESNLTQMASYRNLTHQLVTGINHILDAIPELFTQMVESGDTDGAVKLYQQIFLLAEENIPTGDSGSTEQAIPLENPLTENGVMEDGMAESGITTADSSKTVVTVTGTPEIATVSHVTAENDMAGDGMSENVTAGTDMAGADIQENITADRGTVGTDMREVDIPQNATVSHGTVGFDMVETGTIEHGAIESGAVETGMTENGTTGEGVAHGINTQSILAHEKNILKPLLQLLKEQWTITPEEVADAEHVEGLYRKLNRQLRNLTQTLENTGQTSGTAYKAVTNLTQNLDFLQQINQAYTYVQLPLRLQQGEAHGDLYVYTNKKHLAAKDGQISALLHLDMEHLGPVDVYVAMQQENVNTKFYLQDDEMLDFLMGHMDILTKRLQKRGYQCNLEMQVRDRKDTEESSIRKLLQQENHVPLAEYAFDVRT